jgi:hypothetical protein
MNMPGLARSESSPSAMASAIHALVKSHNTGRTGRILMQVDEVVGDYKYEI